MKRVVGAQSGTVKSAVRSLQSAVRSPTISGEVAAEPAETLAGAYAEAR